MSPRCIGLFVLASSLALPGAAIAGDPATAEQLFDDAKQLAAQGRYADACPKLEQSQKLDPGIGTQFHLADCWQRVGRTASAWALFREVASEARAGGQAGRERVARDRAAALEPSLSKLVVSPGAAAQLPDVRIQRDGNDLPRDLWATPVPVDPGPHVVTVEAPGKQPWQTSVDVPAQGRTATVEIPPLVDLAPPPPPVAAPAAGGTARGVTEAMPAVPPPADVTVVENQGGFQRAVGWIFIGAGLAGLGTGAYFGGKWLDDNATSDRHCTGGVCDQTGIAAQNDQGTQGRNFELATGAGAAGLLVGIVLVVTAPSPRVVTRPAAGLQLSPLAESHGGGLALRAAW